MILFTGGGEMKKFFLMSLLAASLMGVSSIALADLNGFLSSVNRQALSDIKNFNSKLSSQFGVPIPDVEAIVRSVPNPADAFMILHLSHMSHLAPEVVLQRYQRNKGKGWGNLAQQLGIKPGSPEFHALKRGNLAFTGVGGGGAAGKGQGQGKDRKQDREKGQGKGHGKD
jgi:hypothetical protein